MQGSQGSPSGGSLAAFAAAVFIGGTNFVAVRFSNEDLDPQFGAALRFTLAALVFVAIAKVRRLPMPRGRQAVGALLYGGLGFGVAYGLLYYALVGLTAGTTSVILAASPLITLGLAVLIGQERFSVGAVIGGVLAVCGIAVLSAGSLGGDLRPIYLISAFLGAVAVAGSTVIIKGFPQAHPVTTNAVGMGAGVVILTISSLALGERWVLPDEGRTWLVLTWLVLVGSVTLFQLFLFVVKSWTASATMYAIALMPVVTVLLGSLIADEPITLELMAGVVLVMSAVYIGAIRPRARAETALPETAPATAAE